MKYSATFLAFLGATASALELTPETFDEATAGKVVFLKMFAPWCGHCKKMKPDWDKLMDEFKDSETQLIADVDCTAAGKPICDSAGVKGFPTLKYGDPSDLQDYQKGRDYDSLKKFITEELKPVCSPSNLDLCDDEKKKEIEALFALDDATLEEKISTESKKLDDAESKFKSQVEELQSLYQKYMEEKEQTEEDVKSSGLGLMKAVKAAKAKAAAAGKEEL